MTLRIWKIDASFEVSFISSDQLHKICSMESCEQGNSRELKGTQGNSKELKGTHLNSFEPIELKGTQRNSRELKGTQVNSSELI